ncbi:MAG: hypothetical protein H7Z42_04565, partial [Roseiflexaceae bacterium]|nr:hypothetical protein [Roseiflexaceae bacterium]
MTWADADVPSIDHRGLDWTQVRRTRYVCQQRFWYQYDGPVRDLRQQLLVVPPLRYIDQRRLTLTTDARPSPVVELWELDRFGNIGLTFEIEQVERDAVFDISFEVERA